MSRPGPWVRFELPGPNRFVVFDAGCVVAIVQRFNGKLAKTVLPANVAMCRAPKAFMMGCFFQCKFEFPQQIRIGDNSQLPQFFPSRIIPIYWKDGQFAKAKPEKTQLHHSYARQVFWTSNLSDIATLLATPNMFCNVLIVGAFANCFFAASILLNSQGFGISSAFGKSLRLFFFRTDVDQ